MVGEGSIAELSTATADSKFGIPLTAQSRVDIITAIVKHRCVRALMCHVGSQGMSIQVMARGVATLCLLADEIEAACSAAGELWESEDVSDGRIHTIDIGGGLSANYTSDDIKPTFASYVEAILRVYPRFFAQGRRIITGGCAIILNEVTLTLFWRLITSIVQNLVKR
jgi:diaminopimelate decarboxylase